MDKQLISELVANKEEAIKLKKAAIKHTDTISVNNETVKAFTYSVNDDLEKGIITRKLVANTYYYMDSHSDVHINGLFSKSIKETKQIHLHDHIYQLGAKVGTIQSVEEVTLLWRDLCVDKDGYTVSLIVTSEIKKAYNEAIYLQYLNKEIQQHSVGMQYVKLELCVNDADYEEEFSNWNKYAPMVANLDKAIEQGYFWAILEAKLIEVSCVIAGSNPITPTLEPTEPKNEPSNDTQTSLDYKYLIENFKL